MLLYVTTWLKGIICLASQLQCQQLCPTNPRPDYPKPDFSNEV